jgi:isopentenyl diphosphate isomerase/L-lactate dehydrogenase-like FMN-dependent dehydrogenase
VLNPSQSIVFQGMMSEAPTWEDIRWLVEKSEMPVILKGILHPQDAVAAKAIGVAGVIVSNHGGRTLDTVPSAMDVIRTVRATVGPGYPVLLDGGVQRGTDVFKAIAMGADAVLIGRPQVYALAVAGALGVAHMLRVLREELEVAMSLAGTATLADITPDMLFRGVN